MKQLLALFVGLSLAFGVVAAEPAKKAEPAPQPAKANLADVIDAWSDE